jgi:hypothetical protein
MRLPQFLRKLTLRNPINSLNEGISNLARDSIALVCEHLEKAFVTDPNAAIWV